MEPVDTHPDKLQEFWEWLVEYRTQVFLAVIIALGVGTIFYVKKVGNKTDEENASAELHTVWDPYSELEGIDPKAAKSEQFNSVLTNNPGTKAAAHAQYLRACALFEERSYKEAALAFAAYHKANTDPANPLVAAAKFGEAASHDADNNAAGAIPIYTSIISAHADTAEAARAQVALAKLHLRANPPAKDKALEAITAVTGEDGKSVTPALGERGFWRSEAIRLAKELQPAGSGE